MCRDVGQVGNLLRVGNPLVFCKCEAARLTIARRLATCPTLPNCLLVENARRRARYTGRLSVQTRATATISAILVDDEKLASDELAFLPKEL